MKNRLFVLLALVAFGTSCTKDIQEPAPLTHEEQTLMTKLVGGSEGEIVPGSILVKLDSKATGQIEAGNFASVSKELLEGLDIKHFKPAIPIKPKNEAAARKYGLHQWFSIGFDEDINPTAVAEKLASKSSVRSIQYNRFMEPVRAEQAYPADLVMTRSGETDGGFFDDPYSSKQWNLHNDGSLKGSVAGADIGVKDAWRLTAGDPSVIVAVFDCAVAHRHEDLEDAVWRNEPEINGTDDVDDDGNGFIDDKYGFNFVKCFSLNDDYVNGALDGEKQNAVDSQPLNSNGGIGHGTHVAGIIGATNGNGKGVSSIAGGSGNNDGVRLMSCQIFDGDASSADSQSAMAFIYAADNGACIAQCSYGTSHIITNDDLYINGGELDVEGYKDPVKIDGSPLETAALLYFLDPSNSNHEALEGNMAVFAAGNHSNPYSIYPGALPYVISVTAFGFDWMPGGYSNYGPGCNISAPGGEWKGVIGENEGMILSTGLACSVDGGYPGIVTDKGTESKNYVYMQGTSMACPHVSGVLALGTAYAKKLGKKFTREEMTSLLLTSVNDLDQFNDGGTRRFYAPFSTSPISISMSRYKGQMGTGALDAWKFLMAIEGTPSVLAKTGAATSIDLSRYCNPNLGYEVVVDKESSESLGLTADPVIKNGRLEINCTKIGAGKITLKASVGKDPEMEDGIGGMDYNRVISVVSRPFATNNGGWL